jgi:hypothetical protein
LKPGQVESFSFLYSCKKEREGVLTLGVGNQELGTATSRLVVPGLTLPRCWRFKKGDNEAWKEPSFDDSGWEQVQLPAKWEDHSDYREDPAYGWYRTRVQIPENRKEFELTLLLGKIDDADEVFFNGQKIGGMGGFPPEYKTAWSRIRRYALNSDVILYGRENSIAVRVYDGGGGGGVYAGPLGFE